MSLNAAKTPSNDFFLTRELLVAILVLIVTVALFALWKKSRKTNRDVLFVGLCDSGKTALFSSVSYGKQAQSFTSQVENISEYKTRKNMLRLVDVPGHERVFTKYWDAYKASCKSVLFVIDSETVQTDICDVAELLYRVLTDATILSNKSTVLILCNKQDKVMAKGSEVISTLLEKELDTLRLTKSSQLESIDGKKSKTMLGKKKKRFEFSHCQVPVEFAEVNAFSRLEAIKDWLEHIQ